MVDTTLAAVNGSPLENFTPERSWNVQVLRSADGVQVVARSGSMVFWSCPVFTRPSHIRLNSTCSQALAFVTGFSSAMLCAAPMVSTPPCFAVPLGAVDAVPVLVPPQPAVAARPRTAAVQRIQRGLMGTSLTGFHSVEVHCTQCNHRPSGNVKGRVPCARSYRG